MTVNRVLVVIPERDRCVVTQAHLEAACAYTIERDGNFTLVTIKSPSHGLFVGVTKRDPSEEDVPDRGIEIAFVRAYRKLREAMRPTYHVRFVRGEERFKIGDFQPLVVVNNPFQFTF